MQLRRWTVAWKREQPDRIEEITCLPARIREELYPAKQRTGERNHLR
jgi:hypothetical protein